MVSNTSIHLGPLSDVLPSVVTRHYIIKKNRPMGRFPSLWACVGRHWLVWAFVDLRWPSLAVVGRRWPSLAAVGFRGPALANVGFRGPVLAFGGRRWLLWAFVVNKMEEKNEKNTPRAQTTPDASFGPFFI